MEKSSLPPEPDTSEPTEESERLLDRLRTVSDKKVDSAARAVNAYSEDDDAHDKRWAKAETRRTFYKIRRWFFWFLFGLVCILTTICSAGYVFLVWLWVEHVVWGSELSNAQALQDIITGVLWTILVILATLFGESVFKDKEG